MSRNRAPLPPAGQSDALSALRALLDQSDVWPETADQLLTRLGQLPSAEPDTDAENEAMLSLAVDDALKGIDISTQYPAFFQQMLTDQALRQAFLETLEALEAQPDAPLPAAGFSRPVVDFPAILTVRPTVEYTSADRWRLIWQATLDQIQHIFFAAAQFEPVYRSDDYLEDAWFTLFRNEIEIDQAQVSVVLEAVRLITTPDDLQLSIAVGITPDRPETPDRLPDLLAHLTWGTYDQIVTITQRGRATFPPLPLNLVLDETRQHITADLQLTVEPAL